MNLRWYKYSHFAYQPETYTLRDVARSKFVLDRDDPDLESDLQEILGDERPRRDGEEPRNMGGYEWLAPNGAYFEKVQKLKNRCMKTTDGKKKK